MPPALANEGRCASLCDMSHGPNGGCLHRPRGPARLNAMELTDRDRAILDFERSWWLGGGSKELAIRQRFELSATRYYQLLAELVDSSAALAYDPLSVRRLRRMRDRRRRARFAGRPVEERP